MQTSFKEKYPVKEMSGEQCRIIPFREEFINESYIGWLNNPKVNRFLEVRFSAQNYDSVLSFVRSFYGETEKYMWGIFPAGENKYVGTITLYDINRRHGYGEIGLMVGEQEYWGKGLSDEAMKLVMRFGFADLGLRRLTGGSYSANMGMNFTFKRLGFRCEAKLVKAYALTPGNFIDGYRWGILREEWEKLK